ncbi:MAG TPA: hypothetical protein VK519_03080 [Pinirhizobacter sp.]|uniref:hypothetical protein n=1 Tax=Pinirhizobacter sp. TaxID=2950432 RepID=UPI002CD57C36|nr:hypothetical protein [Pinirhizobacter sp.]HMH66883.1 hypothetical protein [Pinirhizobacter sp.]
MSDGLFCLYADFCCSLVMALCGSWLLTDRHLCRLLRVCHALIAAGALTNMLGIVADRLGYEGVSYGHVWPGELITNIGTSVLMSSWVWRSVQRRLKAGKNA